MALPQTSPHRTHSPGPTPRAADATRPPRTRHAPSRGTAGAAEGTNWREPSYPDFLCSRRAGNRCASRKQRLDYLLQELIHLLGSATDETHRIQSVPEVFNRNGIFRVFCQPLEHVVPAAFVLHGAGCSDTVPADDFVNGLTIAASLHGPHDKVFSCHERKFVCQSRANTCRMNLQAAHHVGKQD